MKTIFTFVLAFMCWTFINAQDYLPNLWVPDRNVNAIAFDDEFTYIGGYFSYIGPKTGSGVELSVNNPSPNFNFPIVNDAIYTCVSDDNGGWFIGGAFTKVGDKERNYLAQINADGSVSSWNPNPDGEVFAIGVSGDYVYIGGNFSYIGSDERVHLAKINKNNGTLDQSWNPVANKYVSAIAINGNDIYVGGRFDQIGGVSRNFVAKLNNTDGKVDTVWNPAVSGIDVKAIAADGHNVYIGGYFNNVNGYDMSYFAKLDNTEGKVDTLWNLNIYSSVQAIAVNDKYVYLGTNSFERIAKNTGKPDSLWEPDVNDNVFAITLNGNDVYIGGKFTNVGGEKVRNIARLNAITAKADHYWLPSTNSSVYAMAISGDNIYIGGEFFSAGGIESHSIARLRNTDGTVDTTWKPAITDEEGQVYCIAVEGQDIYIGGSFTQVNGFKRNYIAKLKYNDGSLDSDWALHINESGDYYVSDFEISGTDFYIGGNYGISGLNGQVNYYLADLINDSQDLHFDFTWNPTPDDRVNSIALGDNYLYVAGLFQNIGNNAIPYLARVKRDDGTVDVTWKPNPDNEVKDIVLNGSAIYVGGKFRNIGGKERDYLAKLNYSDGTLDETWKPDAGDEINTLAYKDNAIYAGGYYLRKFNADDGAADESWKFSVGSYYSYIYSIAVKNNKVYVGGEFFTIGDVFQPNLACFPTTLVGVRDNNKIIVNNFTLSQNYPNPFNPSTTINYSIPFVKTGYIPSVELKVYDILGREVAVLVNKAQAPGNYSVRFNANNLPSGIYFFTLKTELFSSTKKMILLR